MASADAGAQPMDTEHDHLSGSDTSDAVHDAVQSSSVVEEVLSVEPSLDGPTAPADLPTGSQRPLLIGIVDPLQADQLSTLGDYLAAELSTTVEFVAFVSPRLAANALSSATVDAAHLPSALVAPQEVEVVVRAVRNSEMHQETLWLVPSSMASCGGQFASAPGCQAEQIAPPLSVAEGTQPWRWRPEALPDGTGLVVVGMNSSLSAALADELNLESVDDVRRRHLSDMVSGNATLSAQGPWLALATVDAWRTQVRETRSDDVDDLPHVIGGGPTVATDVIATTVHMDSETRESLTRALTGIADQPHVAAELLDVFAIEGFVVPPGS